MQLYGSITSPFVRRLRLLLAEVPHEFVHLNIFEQSDRSRLVALNPTRKVPMLEDAGTVVFDSGVIFRYLNQKFAWAPLSWAQENDLTLINAANDSMVELFLCQRSGLDTQEDRLFFNLQRERVQATLAVLADKVKAGDFEQWNYPAMALFALIDWAVFRHTADLTGLPALTQFVAQNGHRAAVAETDPRLIDRQ